MSTSDEAHAAVTAALNATITKLNHFDRVVDEYKDDKPEDLWEATNGMLADLQRINE